MRRSKHSSFALLTWVVSVSTACSSAGDVKVAPAPVGDDSIATVGVAAQGDATLRARLARSRGGYAIVDGALRSAIAPTPASLARIVSRPPSSGAAGWRVAVDDLDDASLTLLDAHANAASTPTTIDGRVVYRDVYTSTDTVHLHDGMGAEELLVLKDSHAPGHFEWEVARGAALVDVRTESDGGVSFRDPRGRARIFVARPFAVDANGVHRDAELRWSHEKLSIDLDRTGLAYPIVLDPYVGTARWVRVPVNPGPRHGCAMTSVGSNLVLFGGKSGPRLNDTWTWNGDLWKQAQPAMSPSGRAGTTMSPLGAKAILFGGIDADAKSLDDTWSWDGAQWTQLAPTHSPSPRGFPLTASFGDKIVMYGGAATEGTDLYDTWVFDGTDWTQVDSADFPTISAENLGVAIATTGATATLVSIQTGETWTFDGSAWTDLSATANTPTVSSNNDGLEALGLAAGQLTLQTTFGTFAFKSSVWTPIAPVDSPPWRMDQCSASLAGTLALFGGDSQGGDLDDFWTYSAGNWTQPFSHSSPTPRADPSVAILDDKLVLFGGVDAMGSYSLTDTWEFDGKVWTPITTTNAPDTSSSNAFANAGNVAVLFDGTNTWIWDGSDWSPAPGSTGPSLFGAFTSYKGTGLYLDPMNDAQWTWSGSAWTQVPATVSAPLASLHTFPDGTSGATEVGRFAFILADAPGWSANNSWLWDGTSWGQLAIEGLPLRNEIGMATLGNTVVVFGGGDAQGILSSETYTLDIALSTGTVCAADGDCDSGFCAQGVCCNARCGDATSSCALPATRGTCAPIQAVCLDSTTLQGADGSSTSCAPYLCAAAACPTSCATSSDCVGGYVCDPGSQTCVSAPTGSARAAGGCSIGVGAGLSRTRSIALIAAVFAAILRRSRRTRVAPEA
jgi:hypothetical protein